MNRIPMIAVIAAAALACGCGSGNRQWEFVVENANAQPCSVTISYVGPNGSGSASVDGIQPGHTLSLVAGNGSTTVDTIKLKLGANERTSAPKLKVTAGQRFKLVVKADGSLDESVTDR